MAYEALTGLNVKAQYGPRTTGGAIGVTTDKDSIHELIVDMTWQSITEGAPYPFVLPRGAHFYRYILRVDEALVLTGTTPTLVIGAVAGPSANGIVLTQAEVGAVGTKTPASTGVGEWAVASATGTTVASKLGIVLGGTTPAITPGAGKLRLICEYVMSTKV